MKRLDMKKVESPSESNVPERQQILLDEVQHEQMCLWASYLQNSCNLYRKAYQIYDKCDKKRTPSLHIIFKDS